MLAFITLCYSSTLAAKKAWFNACMIVHTCGSSPLAICITLIGAMRVRLYRVYLSGVQTFASAMHMDRLCLTEAKPGLLMCDVHLLRPHPAVSLWISPIIHPLRLRIKQPQCLVRTSNNPLYSLLWLKATPASADAQSTSAARRMVSCKLGIQ